jgi:hypothetical protein
MSRSSVPRRRSVDCGIASENSFSHPPVECQGFSCVVAFRVMIRRPPMADTEPCECFQEARRSELRSVVRRQRQIFLQEIVMISPGEITAMRARGSWLGLMSSIVRLLVTVFRTEANDHPDASYITSHR